MSGTYDVAVIGGGPAGLSAALAARDMGARVLLIDRDDWLGGILQQCIHPGFGLHLFGEELTGPEYAHRYISRLGPGLEVLLNTAVLEIGGDSAIVMSSPGRGIHRVTAGSLVLAMGCREKTRVNCRIAGYRPAGIFTAGTAQRLINVDGLMVGGRILIVGSGDVGLIMARRCTLEGARVVGVVEQLAEPSGLTRNVVQCLEDFDIPLLLNHRVRFIEGRRRVTGVRIVGEERGDAKARHVSCDTVLLSVGLIPEIELLQDLGVPLDPATGGPRVDNAMQTERAGVYACGNLVQVYDLVDWVSEDGAVAGRAAALQSLRGRGSPEAGPSGAEMRGRTTRVIFSGDIRSVVPQTLRPYGKELGAKKVLTLRVARQMKNPTFVLTRGGAEIGSIRKAYAVPSEMTRLDIASFYDETLASEEVRVTVEERRDGPSGKRRAGGVSVGGRGGAAAVGLVTCIVCPKACVVRVFETDDGLETEGAECARGREYALTEITSPRRVFTSTVPVSGGEPRRVSVRTSGPIPRDLWRDAQETVREMRVDAPVRLGYILMRDFVERGIDLVVTRDAPAERIGGKK
jgi:NADPH-dependent 2,4-dienoyl-CoA reductase/sulfur reductase-like enzyme/CxxC motif-containing protein